MKYSKEMHDIKDHCNRGVTPCLINCSYIRSTSKNPFFSLRNWHNALCLVMCIGILPVWGLCSSSSIISKDIPLGTKLSEVFGYTESDAKVDLINTVLNNPNNECLPSVGPSLDSVIISKAKNSVLDMSRVDAKFHLLTSAIMNDPVICYAFADVGNNLTTINRSTGVQTNIGVSNVSDVEAITISMDGNTVYGANGGTWGYFNLGNAQFTSIGNFGSGNGDQGNVTMDDVDGLAIDGTEGTFYGTHREGDGSAPEDILFMFNPITGSIITDGFGSDEYVSVEATNYLGTDYHDIDDIAFDPINGTMYGVANENGSVNLLITINKSTGATTLIGRLQDTGGSFLLDVEGLSFFNDGTFYLTTGTNPGHLYTLNTSTAVATLVGTLTIGYDYEGLACLTGGGGNTIQGTVFDDDDLSGVQNGAEGGANNITVFLYEDTNKDGSPDGPPIQTQSTGSSGDYSFSVQDEGQYIVSIDDTGLTMTTDNIEIINFIGTGSTSSGHDFGLSCIAQSGENVIAGTVYSDENINATRDSGEVGTSGIQVNLYEDNLPTDGTPDGPAIQTTNTNANGNFEFTENLVFTQNFMYSQRIGQSSDDATELTKDSKVELNKNELKFGKGDDYVGLRFTVLNIPSNATISSAFMYFDVDDKGGNDKGSGSSIIRVEDSASPLTFLNNKSDISSRSTLGTTVNWTVGPWNDESTNNPTPDVATLFQALQTSVGTINDVAFIIQNDNGSEEQKAISWDDVASQAPKLEVVYSIPGNGPFDYVIDITTATLPPGAILTTDNTESAFFDTDGTSDCNNDFGYLACVDANAGTGSSTTVCDDSGDAIDLFGLLAGEDSGGVWTRLSGTGGTFNAGAGTFVPTAASSSTFRYSVTAIPPCADDSEDVSVNVTVASDAGIDGNSDACNDSAEGVYQVGLDSVLAGSPDGGGS